MCETMTEQKKAHFLVVENEIEQFEESNHKVQQAFMTQKWHFYPANPISVRANKDKNRKRRRCPVLTPNPTHFQWHSQTVPHASISTIRYVP